MKGIDISTPEVSNLSTDHGWARQVPGNGSIGKHQLFTALDRKWVHLSYVLIDLILIFFNSLLAFYSRFVTVPTKHAIPSLSMDFGENFPLRIYVGFLMLYSILIVLLCNGEDLYRTPRGRSASQESWAVIRAVSMATFLLIAFIFCTNVKVISREVLLVSALLNLLSLVVWRAKKRQFVTRRVQQGIGARNALIIGAGRVGNELADYLEKNKQLGYKFIGFLDCHLNSDSRVLGNIQDLARVARTYFVDEVFVTISSERDIVKRLAAEGRRQHLNVKLVPDLYDGLARNVPIQQLGEFPMIELHWEPIPTIGLFGKRIADCFLSVIALVALAPVLALLALAVKVDSPGPLLYKSKRVGRKGAEFTCYKIRTMQNYADSRKDELRHLNERSSDLFFKMERDPRVTRVGRILRRYSLDEAPQLWNVLKGEMSLVGPRPPLPVEVDRYSLEHLRRLDIKPGITGLWQVTARMNPSFDSFMALDLEYIERWCFWLDAKILWKTIPAVFRGEGR